MLKYSTKKEVYFMSYEQNEKNMIQEGKELLKLYEQLLRETNIFLSKFGKNPKINNFTKSEELKWMKFLITNSDMIKITRLGAALHFVNDPEDKDAISNLKEQMQISASDARRNAIRNLIKRRTNRNK